MDSTNSYSISQGFVNLLTSQEDIQIPPHPDQYERVSPTIDLGSSEVPFFSSLDTDDPTDVVDDSKERLRWTPKEDVILISAWLNTSKDPIVSNEQKAGAFWARIQVYYNASPLLAGVQRREATHCKQRWKKLNDQVCKFVGCYEVALKEKASGQNEDNVMKAALEIFFNDHGSRFTLEHAWRELRHDQKWCSSASAADGARAKKRKVKDGSAQSETSETVSHGHDTPMGRPPGVKASKANAKKGTEQGNAMQELRNILEMRKLDTDIKEKISKNKLLDSLLAKTEPLSDIEVTLKNKLINDMLS